MVSRVHGACKAHLSASINHLVLRDFDDFCRKRCINKSLLIENILRQFMQDPDKNLKNAGGGIE